MSHPLLGDCPVVVVIPVQWGEMDAYGHVNNTVFFRYFETARIAYLDRCGFLEAHERDKVGAILHSTDCRFRLPLFYPDIVHVGASATAVDSDRFTLRYRVVSEGQDAVAAEGSSIVVSFDYVNRQKVPIPESVRAGIERLERGAAVR